MEQFIMNDRLNPALLTPESTPSSAARNASLSRRYETVRAATVALAAPLSAEDYVVQSMPDVSPTKWHLAHTSWFFETFLLAPHAARLPRRSTRTSRTCSTRYYNAVGDRHCRPERGLLSAGRPSRRCYAYRAHVDAAHGRAAVDSDEAAPAPLAPLIELGLHHEQQHQELMLTDIKHVFWRQPAAAGLRARRCAARRVAATARRMRWVALRRRR